MFPPYYDVKRTSNFHINPSREEEARFSFRAEVCRNFERSGGNMYVQYTINRNSRYDPFLRDEFVHRVSLLSTL